MSQITAVGDGGVGKTCVLLAYTTDEDLSLRAYLPTIFETYKAVLEVDGEIHEIQLWDTAGQEDYDRLRPLSYTKTDCFLICFSIGDKSTYENVTEKWVPEVKHYRPNVPLILVGTKVDTRNNGRAVLNYRDGEYLKEKIGASAYIECSAFTRQGINEVFISAIRAIRSNKETKKKEKRRCNVL